MLNRFKVALLSALGMLGFSGAASAQTYTSQLADAYSALDWATMATDTNLMLQAAFVIPLSVAATFFAIRLLKRFFA